MELINCQKCKEYKPISDFQKRSRNKIGRLTWCKSCVKEKKQEQSKWFKSTYKISPEAVKNYEEIIFSVKKTFYKPILKCSVVGQDIDEFGNFKGEVHCDQPVFYTKPSSIYYNNQIVPFCRKHYHEFITVIKTEFQIKSIK